MFLGAVLRGAGLCVPVKVRNMSPTGALVDCPVRPDVGTVVELVRGSLAVSGSVAWTADGRLGLRFSSLVCVADWLAPPSDAGQQRVDDAVRLLKLGALPMQQRPGQSAGAAHPPRSIQFADDLERVARLIDALGEKLSSDAAILARHGEALQNLEIAMQTIDMVADILGGRADGEAAAARMDSLRLSCAAAMRKVGIRAKPAA